MLWTLGDICLQRALLGCWESLENLCATSSTEAPTGEIIAFRLPDRRRRRRRIGERNRERDKEERTIVISLLLSIRTKFSVIGASPSQRYA